MRQKRHGCGHRIWRNWVWNGLEWFWRYMDDEEDSPTVGDRISHCRTCGEYLSPDVLLTEEAYLDSLDEAPPASE